jgi:hypothetical protein
LARGDAFNSPQLQSFTALHPPISDKLKENNLGKMKILLIDVLASKKTKIRLY